MSNWGKAHENNSIGFGQGSNNSIGWGSIYEKTYSGETILTGANPFKDATVAYSLRDLFLGAESVVRVRRDSDNAEQDFTATEITDGTLTSFCGAGDGFVSVWYDQSGSGNDATQITASNQPRIVNSGSLILENGKPSIDFEDVNNLKQLENNTFQALGNDSRSFFSVQTQNSLSDRPCVYYFGEDSISGGVYSVLLEPAIRVSGDNIIFDNSPSIGSQNILSVIHPQETNIANDKIFLDGIESTVTDPSNENTINTKSGFVIGAYFAGVANTLNFTGTIQEVVGYLGNKSSERQEIETNINNYYGIY